jgi:uncharacterized membrane protein YjjP (DUF1212 family)
MSPLSYVTSGLQLIAGLGILNVWLIRSNWKTNFRGGSATNLKEEFSTYGLPPFMFYFVGALKVLSALTLIVTVFLPFKDATIIAASALFVLMLGAISMHIKVRDPLTKSLPAISMATISFVIFSLNVLNY